jgi:hypothetical protein
MAASSARVITFSISSSRTKRPNKPFHLTPASLPAVARSAAGERQR